MQKQQQAEHEVVHDHHPQQDQPAIKRIIAIGVDQSPHTRECLAWALENYIRAETDLVVLLNARPYLSSLGEAIGACLLHFGPYGSAFVDFTECVITAEQEQRAEAHVLLHELAKIVKKRKVAVKAIAMKGDAREMIAAKVEEIAADALILGSRELGTLQRAFLGSVSDYCVHHVHSCPVIIFKRGGGKKSQPAEAGKNSPPAE
ncbi:hypothetical protein HK101_003856 [Irineochytrium annulatum]|nr:hypothetical protein HK101_003856 [Irineochytrium annulatum]